MVSAISSSLWGLGDATARFNRASQHLLESTSGASQDDPVDAIVEQIEAKTQFKASAATLRAADEMTGTLLDIIA